ncbi:homeobox-leucine zipper protein PROTODERMAL FACTOR 2-like [Capsicum galapagoense]
MEERGILRLENERLHAENLQMYSELNKRICANCNNAKQKRKILQELQNKKDRLTEEITRMSNMVAHFEEDPVDCDNDPNGIDLELRLECNDDPNGPDLKVRLG